MRGDSRRLFRDQRAAVGAALLTLAALAAIAAPLLAGDPIAQRDIVATRFLPPLATDPLGAFHLLGTDRFGRDLWARLATDRIPRPTAPAIDFSARVVVVAAMGTRPTGGHAIRIDRVSYAGDTLWVEVTSVTPGPGCATTQALTAPVAAVSVERRPNVSARFLDREETLDCE